MTERSSDLEREGRLTRRRLVAGVALVVGGGLASGVAQGPANDARTTLQYEVGFKASPQRIYDVLLSSKEFAAFTGLPAEIDAKVGGAFSMFGGQIAGRNVELVPGERIVQAWRPSHWDAGVYSIVKFELRAQGVEAMVVLDHTGFPAGDADSLDKGWHMHYLEPMGKYFG